MLWLIIQIFVTLFIGLLIVLYLQQLQKSKKIQLPTPPLIPLLGHALEFGSTAQGKSFNFFFRTILKFV